jgi:predicted nuclease with TOPRIM domain
MRKDRERLQGVINSANTKLSSLQSEVATLEGQKKSLDKAVEVAHELSLRSESIDSGSQEIKNLIRERVVEYQALKESTDEFSSWTHELKDQTASMRSLGASQSLLRNTTKRIVDSLLDKDQKDVKRICEKLKRL